MNPLNGLTQQVPLKAMAISQIAIKPNMAETSPKLHQIDGQNDALRKILKNRFKDAPFAIKRCFPKVISGEKLKYFLIKCDKYILLIFVDDDDKNLTSPSFRHTSEGHPGFRVVSW